VVFAAVLLGLVAVSIVGSLATMERSSRAILQRREGVDAQLAVIHRWRAGAQGHGAGTSVLVNGAVSSDTTEGALGYRIAVTDTVWCVGGRHLNDNAYEGLPGYGGRPNVTCANAQRPVRALRIQGTYADRMRPGSLAAIGGQRWTTVLRGWGSDSTRWITP
jgi:hypothetical protein